MNGWVETHPYQAAKKYPSGAKALGFIGYFAAVRVKTLTYQSCPDIKQQKANANKQPQVLRLTTPGLKSTPGAPFAQDDKRK